MNQSPKMLNANILSQIQPLPAVQPPQLDIAALREEAERRLLRRQLAILSVGAILSLIAILLALFILLRISFAEGMLLLALPAVILCPMILSGGAAALILFIQRRKKEWL